MATKRSQRIGIWIIAIVMAVGSLGVYFVSILATDNAAKDSAAQQEAYAKYQKEYEEYTAKKNAQTTELSSKYYDTFKQYASRPASFDASEVKELKTEDLKVGDGEEIKEGTSYHAYYIGWNPSGKVFDQSIDGDKLKEPIAGESLIEGWTNGVIGMKTGGVRLLTIPSAQAYGESGSGEDIPANTPIKFVVMIIPAIEEITPPDYSALLQYQ